MKTDNIKNELKNEVENQQESDRPINPKILIENYLRSPRVEKEEIKSLIKKILDDNLNYIPSFKVRLSELEEGLLNEFREEPIKFLEHFREELINRLTFEVEIKELIKKHNISKEQLNIIPESEEGVSSFIPLVKDLSLDLTNYVNKIVTFYGKNMSIGFERGIEYRKMVYSCLLCGAEFEVNDPYHKIGERYRSPRFCISRNCKAKNKSDFKIVEEKCESYEIRKFLITDLDNERTLNECKCIIIRNMEEAILKSKDLDIESPVEIIGILHIDNTDLFKNQKPEQEFSYWIEVIDFKPKEIRVINQDIIKEIKNKIGLDHNFLFEIIDSVQPYSKGIYDYFPVKVLNCLSIITADSWDKEKNIRNTLNSIIGGHRGTLKTSLARYLQSILRINNFGLLSGKNTTEKGLIPTVQRNNREKNLIRRYGALRYYNRKTLTLDEAQYLAIAVLEILKCLDDGEITRGLDGSIINAETKLTVILLLNYKTENEAYDYSKTLIENLGFPKEQLSILDRFDLHYAIPKLSLKVRKILKKRNYRPVIDYVSKDHIYNWLLEGKKIYSNGVKIPIEIYNLIDVFDDVICSKRPKNAITSSREFTIILKLLRGISALKLKEEVDGSDFDFLKRHLLTTIIPYQENAFVSNERIIDINFVFKNTFSLLTELSNSFSIEDHISFIRELLENNYFTFEAQNNTGKIDMDEILVGVSVKDLQINGYMPDETSLGKNRKYRTLIENLEIMEFINRQGFIMGKINNKTHFIKEERLYRIILDELNQIYHDNENSPCERESLIQGLEFKTDYDRTIIDQALNFHIQNKNLIKTKGKLLKLDGVGGDIERGDR